MQASFGRPMLQRCVCHQAATPTKQTSNENKLRPTKNLSPNRPFPRCRHPLRQKNRKSFQRCTCIQASTPTMQASHLLKLNLIPRCICLQIDYSLVAEILCAKLKKLYWNPKTLPEQKKLYRNKKLYWNI